MAGFGFGWLRELTARSHDRAWFPALSTTGPVESCLLGILRRIAPPISLDAIIGRSSANASTFLANSARGRRKSEKQFNRLAPTTLDRFPTVWQRPGDARFPGPSDGRRVSA